MVLLRSSGILLHLTSLPSPHGIGDLGKSGYEFVDFLSAAGQKIWQVLPLNPTGFGDSPYQSFSSFAGNALFVDLLKLQEQGLLVASDFTGTPSFADDSVDYGRVIPFKHSLLDKAAQAFFADADSASRGNFESFCAANASWLDDYALFMAAKSFHQGRVWTEWDAALRLRENSALAGWRRKLAGEIAFHQFVQFEFFRQWKELRKYGHSRGIRIMGDIPIYVAHDSADVWAHPELFWLDAGGKATVVAGVPPDYFSATGQLWGNPLYRWAHLENTGFAWWVDRFRAALELFDLVRLDHFRGFEAYWEVPANASTAMNGKWVKGPGRAFFASLEQEFGELPVIAENLGVITPEVEAIRHEFGFPGMSLLQFAFGTDPQGPSFRPHNYSPSLAAYTGGHDNDTTVGWWTSVGVGESTRTAEDIRKEREFAQAYLGFRDEPIHWVFIRAVLASVAAIAMIPLQDVLGLSSTARMNLPGTTSGNWRWRYRREALTAAIRDRLREWALMYDR